MWPSSPRVDFPSWVAFRRLRRCATVSWDWKVVDEVSLPALAYKLYACTVAVSMHKAV